MGSVLVSSGSSERSGRLAEDGSQYRLGMHLTTIGQVVGFRCQIALLPWAKWLIPFGPSVCYSDSQLSQEFAQLLDEVFSVFLSGQAGLSGGFQMRAGPGLQAFPAGLAVFLGGLSLNRIFCSKDSLLPLLRKSPKYET